MGAIGFNSNNALTVNGEQPNWGMKNYIINGNFDIWQRATTQTSSGFSSDDRWRNVHLGSTKTHSQVACTDTERALFNANYFSRTVVSSVAGDGNWVNKSQSIEDVTKLAGKTVTVSFWAKADTAKNIAIEFIQNFGTGGTPSSSVLGIGAQLVSLTTAWQRFSITVNIPSIVGKTLGTDGVHTSHTSFYFWFDAGSNFDDRTASLSQQSGTFDIAQVQLEEGSVATPFEQRPYGLELSLCQRYYEKTNDNTSQYFTGWIVSAIAKSYFKIVFKTTKRITPTLTVFAPDGTSGSMNLYNSTTPTKLAVEHEMSSANESIFRYAVSGYTLAIGGYSASAEL